MNQINIQKTITIKSNKPIKEIVSNKFIYPTKNDSLKAYLENAFTINVPFSPNLGETNRLIVLEKAVIGIDNTYNDSINFNIDFNPTHYSVLNIKSVSSNQNRRIELFNTTDIVHHEQLIDSILVKWINPGNYRLRVFRDNNKNGVWDPGQINLNIPAEPIRVYPEIIKLRANWETEFLIDF